MNARDRAALDQGSAALRDLLDAVGVNVADPDQLAAVKAAFALAGRTILGEGIPGLIVVLRWAEALEC